MILKVNELYTTHTNINSSTPVSTAGMFKVNLTGYTMEVSDCIILKKINSNFASASELKNSKNIELFINIDEIQDAYYLLYEEEGLKEYKNIIETNNQRLVVINDNTQLVNKIINFF